MGGDEEEDDEEEDEDEDEKEEEEDEEEDEEDEEEDEEHDENEEHDRDDEDDEDEDDDEEDDEEGEEDEKEELLLISFYTQDLLFSIISFLQRFVHLFFPNYLPLRCALLRLFVFAAFFGRVFSFRDFVKPRFDPP